MIRINKSQQKLAYESIQFLLEDMQNSLHELVEIVANGQNAREEQEISHCQWFLKDCMYSLDNSLMILSSRKVKPDTVQ